MSALACGAALGARRLANGRSVLVVGLALALVLLGALLERRASPLLATDRTLVGIVFGVVLPLLCWGVVTRITARRRLEDSVHELARHGADRRLATAGLLLVAAAAAALGALLLAELAVLATRWPADPRLAGDLVTSGWIALLAGGAYAAWFALASTLGRSGGGRGWALVVDWVFGAGASLVALPWPRGHVRNLLGAEPVFGMPQWSATAALFAMALLYGLFALARSPR